MKTTKLHCNHCGKLRLQKVGFLIEKPEEIDPAIEKTKEDERQFAFVPVKVKGLKANINNKQIPKAYIAQCYVCHSNTFFEIKEVRKGKHITRSLVIVG